MNDNNKITGIIDSVDDTLSKIGPVRATLIKTSDNKDYWRLKLDFEYKDDNDQTKTATVYTLASRGTGKVDPLVGARLMDNFLESTPINIAFYKKGVEISESTDKTENLFLKENEFGKYGRPGLSIPLGDTLIWDGIAYERNGNSWFTDMHIKKAS